MGLGNVVDIVVSVIVAYFVVRMIIDLGVAPTCCTCAVEETLGQKKMKAYAGWISGA